MRLIATFVYQTTVDLIKITLPQGYKPMRKIEIAKDAPESVRTLVDTINRSGIPQQAKIIYEGRNRIAAFTARDGEVFNIKAFRVPHVINRVAYGWFRGSKAHRAFENAVRLRELNVSTPRPFAFIEEFDSIHCLHKSYYLCSQLPDDYNEIRYAGKNPDFDNIVRDVAAFVADFHKKGVWMIDLTPGNIMFRHGKNGYEFALVDVNRMKFDVSSTDVLVRSCGRLFCEADSRRLFAGYYAEAMCLDAGYVLDLMERQVKADSARRRRKKALFHPKEFFNPG